MGNWSAEHPSFFVLSSTFGERHSRKSVGPRTDEERNGSGFNPRSIHKKYMDEREEKLKMMRDKFMEEHPSIKSEAQIARDLRGGAPARRRGRAVKLERLARIYAMLMEPKSLAAIGRVENLTRERVRQIKKRQFPGVVFPKAPHPRKPTEQRTCKKEGCSTVYEGKPVSQSLFCATHRQPHKTYPGETPEQKAIRLRAYQKGRYNNIPGVRERHSLSVKKYQDKIKLDPVRRANFLEKQRVYARTYYRSQRKTHVHSGFGTTGCTCE